jgi:O-acetyl-ADP-ribose deacetylase (regulator of RNase III)/NAD-dependent SIR2 family protein deacetylase
LFGNTTSNKTTNATTMHLSEKSAVIKAALVSAVRRENIEMHPSVLDQSADDLLRLLGNLLISSNSKWKEETLQLIDKVWEEDAKQATRTEVGDIDGFASINGTELALWKGDITCLRGERLVIVNAANDQGLGCFVPDHKCIDNIIHRRAGPRLRLECEKAMLKRGYPLSAGTEPIVTKGYHLPSTHVVHVTGPKVRKGNEVHDIDVKHLASAYDLSLRAASTLGAGTLAFPCISTGLFGFPPDRAAEVALVTVQKWLEENPNVYQRVIFNVFSEKDRMLYEDLIRSKFGNANMVLDGARAQTLDLAKQWIDEADAILICAGAGMSVKEGEMVYTNPADFANAYPFFTKWGYTTGYEAMGLAGDTSVPQTAKWAFWAKHMDNMRWKFTPNHGYTELLGLVGEKDHFVLTSNVDGCFERSGFDSSRIYTPQGEWTFLQCMGPCKPDSVYEARPYLDGILPYLGEEGHIPVELLPKCPQCGEDMFGNVRGGSWYLHHKYHEQSHAIQKWMEDHISNGSKVAILEIGAGFNTPTVTRFVVESFARELGCLGRFIRINPTEAAIPEDLRAVAFEEGWQVLRDLAMSSGLARRGHENGTCWRAEIPLEKAIRKQMAGMNLIVSDTGALQYYCRLGHVGWRGFLQRLRGDGQ